MRIVWLVTPAGDREMVQGALRSNADVVFPCLEDGTPYTDEAKREARGVLSEVLAGTDTDADVYPRINELTSEYWRDDMEAIVPAEPDGIIVANATSPENLRDLSRYVRELERSHGIEPDSIGLACLVENPRAVRNAYELSTADERMDAVLFGADDFAQSLGALKEDGRRYETLRSELDYPKSKIAIDASAGDRERVDSAPLLVDDEYIFEESNKAARLGFTGKIALHPSQIDPIHRGFAPPKAEVERSREIIERHEEDVGGTINDVLVVPPVVKQAKFVLERFEKLRYREDVGR
jgi:citrate lyase subunit beta/citryl-CoA lyase